MNICKEKKKFHLVYSRFLENESIVELLINEFTINHPNEAGLTPLSQSVKAGMVQLQFKSSMTHIV